MSKVTGKQKIKLVFNYKKSEDFATYYATGAIGGITHQGLINMNLFTDRVVIPKQTSVEIEENGIPTSPEGIEDALPGSVREIFCGVLITVENAKNISKWLNEKIELIESIQQPYKK